MIIILLKTNDKGKTLIAAREKKHVTQKGSEFKIIVDFSSETLQAIGEWMISLKN